MQFGDRLDQTQAQSDARGAAAGIAAVKPLHDLGFLRVFYARSIIGDGYFHSAILGFLHADFDGAVGGCVFQRIINEVAQDLSQQHRVPRHHDRAAGPYLEVDVLQLRRRLVEFHGVDSQVRNVERYESGTAQACIDLREPEQRIEYADPAVDIRDGTFDFGKGLFGGRPNQREFLEPRAQFGERCTQI